MAKSERLSQQVLLEVLTREIEEMKEASALVSKHYPEAKENIERMREQVNRIEQLVQTGRIKVNTEGIEKVFQQQGEILEQKLKKAQIIPKWLIITFLSVCGLLLVSGIANYVLWEKAKKAEDQAIYWYNRAQKLEKKNKLEHNRKSHD